ncbi:MAG TPA: hypothetical protein VGM25_01815 [Caulobacteraceae bacterium]
MALSVGSEIQLNDIRQVEVLKPGTVYKLIGQGNDTVVVKSEAGNLTKDSFNVTKAVMKTVDRGAAKAKALTDREKNTVKEWAQIWADYTQYVAECRLTAAQIPAPVADLLSNFQLNPHALWFKMPLADVADLKGALNSRMAPTVDKNPIKAFEKALEAKGGLEALGRIIACDMFINNTDRLSPLEGSSLKFGPREVKLRVIKNIGNIFLVNNGTNRTLSGMDFVDPNTGYRHYQDTLDEVNTNYNEQWLGYFMVDTKARAKFCKYIISDLELVLHPNRSSLSLSTGLGRDAAKRLEKGMVAGARQLVTGLDQKYRNSPLKKPAGMESRLTEYRGI